MEDEASPIRAFARECCGLSPPYEELCDDAVHPAYTEWCRENGHRPLVKSRFRRKIMEPLHSVTVRQRGGRGEQQWVCHGLKLNDRGLDLLERANEREREKEGRRPWNWDEKEIRAAL